MAAGGVVGMLPSEVTEEAGEDDNALPGPSSGESGGRFKGGSRLRFEEEARTRLRFEGGVSGRSPSAALVLS